jgi:hypothetical protein
MEGGPLEYGLGEYLGGNLGFLVKFENFGGFE